MTGLTRAALEAGRAGAVGALDGHPCSGGTLAARHSMVFLTGEMGPNNMWFERLKAQGWGRMFSSRWHEPYPGEPWGLDNGAYTCWQQGTPWDADGYLQRAELAAEAAVRAGAPAVAILPDIVADPRSLDHSLTWLERLAGFALPWFLAVQDGMTPAQIGSLLANEPRISGLFLGGSDGFKSTAPAWSELAHAHARRFHYGRAGTPRKLRLALDCGADSADSTRACRSRRDWFAMLAILTEQQPMLPLDTPRRSHDGQRRRYAFDRPAAPVAPAPAEQGALCFD